MKIAPLKAATPEEAEALADRLYRMMPNLRITSLLAEVDRWTCFSGAFTHLHSGAPADDRRVALTAVLADGTNSLLEELDNGIDHIGYWDVGASDMVGTVQGVHDDQLAR